MLLHMVGPSKTLSALGTVKRLQARMGIAVLLQGRRIEEPFLAHVATETADPLLVVSLYVRLQGPLQEVALCGPTNGAHKLMVGLVVRLDVRGQFLLVHKSLVAEVALVRPIAGVSHSVSLQIGRLLKDFAAEVAFDGGPLGGRGGGLGSPKMVLHVRLELGRTDERRVADLAAQVVQDDLVGHFEAFFSRVIQQVVGENKGRLALRTPERAVQVAIDVPEKCLLRQTALLALWATDLATRDLKIRRIALCDRRGFPLFSLPRLRPS